MDFKIKSVMLARALQRKLNNGKFLQRMFRMIFSFSPDSGWDVITLIDGQAEFYDRKKEVFKHLPDLS